MTGPRLVRSCISEGWSGHAFREICVLVQLMPWFPLFSTLERQLDEKPDGPRGFESQDLAPVLF